MSAETMGSRTSPPGRSTTLLEPRADASPSQQQSWTCVSQETRREQAPPAARIPSPCRQPRHKGLERGKLARL